MRKKSLGVILMGVALVGSIFVQAQCPMCGGWWGGWWGPGMGWWGFLWMLFGFVLFILFILFIIFAVYWLYRQLFKGSQPHH